MTHMVLDIWKHFQMINLIILGNFGFKLSRIQSLGLSLPLANTLVSLVLDMAQMVLAVWLHLQMTNMIMLDNYHIWNFPRKSIHGEEVLALGLILGVFGAGHVPNVPGSP